VLLLGVGAVQGIKPCVVCLLIREVSHGNI
jgi:disulfide bond formation protein DsbB